MVPGSAMAFKAKKDALDSPEVLCYASKSDAMFVPDSLIFRWVRARVQARLGGCVSMSQFPNLRGVCVCAGWFSPAVSCMLPC